MRSTSEPGESFASWIAPRSRGFSAFSGIAWPPLRIPYEYLGPPIGEVFDNRLDPVEANRFMWGWLEQQCPNAIDFENTFNILDPYDCVITPFVEIPGVTEILDPHLSSTTANEFSLGYQRDFGRIGNLRLDWVHREFGDFIATRRDLETGQGVTEQGKPFDQGIIVNENDLLERNYDGLHTAFNFRFLDSRLRIGGTWTWAHVRGNTDDLAVLSTSVLEFPEYSQLDWTAPRGDLEIDRRHTLRAWFQYDLLNRQRHRLNLSWLENLWGGTPYTAIGTIDPFPYIDNPGYLKPPSAKDYYYSPRGAFRTDTVHRSDLAINYSLFFDRWELFLQPSVQNLFNEAATTGANTTVIGLEPFDPFTETPTEGVHWRKGDHFGQPLTGDDLQEVRTFSFTAGIRFNP